MRRKSSLSRYQGSLTPAQAAAGSAAALRNAERLIQDAKFLLGVGRHLSALGLAVLAAEEQCKAESMWLFALPRTSGEWKVVWATFYDHQFKHAPLLGALRKAITENHPDLIIGDLELRLPDDILDIFKEGSFYVDVSPDGQFWMEPSRRFKSAEGVRSFVQIVQQRVASTCALEVRKIELCVEHLRPIAGEKGEQWELALKRCYAAMEREGLAPHI